VPWSLKAPLSREVVVAGGGNGLVVAGGLTATSQSAPGVYLLDTTDGTLSRIGVLQSGVHDAAGALVGGSLDVFGGGSPSTVATVQSIALPPSATVGSQASSSLSGANQGVSGVGVEGSPAASTQAATVGSLPQPRSDSVAVTVGNTAYIVGGYDGTNADPEVLATSDGVHYRTVAPLAVPVRYPAVAALGSTIYVFGGEMVGGSGATDAIQAVDIAHRTVRVVGRMPAPLEGAAAFVLAGTVYVAGGVTPDPQAFAPPGSESTTASPVSATPSSSPSPGSPGGAASQPGWVFGADSQASSGGMVTISAVEAFQATGGSMLYAGTLPDPTAYAGSAVVGNRAWLVGGEVAGSPVATVEMVTPNRAFGLAGEPGAGSPYYGAQLLVADRGNDRLLLLDDTGKIVWQYPSAQAPPPPGGFYFPDDAFFAKHGTEIISNQEENETIVVIAYPSGKILWQYGHAKVPGDAPGYLHEPDDAYLLPNGQITVADADNCRVLVINPDGTVASQIGTNLVCVHNPPVSMTSPNGDTPLKNGDLLVSEIVGSWVDEYTPQGKLIWSVHVPVAYPSDPQQLGPNLYLISDYSRPGAILEFNSQGQVLYRYQAQSGPGELNQPSLTELLPSGVFMSNDDYNDRMVAIDPATQAVVWQYGVDGVAGSAPGELSRPDGFDLLLPDGTTPTHPYTG